MEEPATAPLLTVTSISKRFGGLEALAGCTLSVGEGSITGLIGPNGAGKTTLFNVISGLTPADDGQIRLGDRLSAHAIARRGVGRTFQIPRPLGRMTVLENVLVYAHGQLGEGLVRVFTTPKRVRAEESRASGDPVRRPEEAARAGARAVVQGSRRQAAVRNTPACDQLRERSMVHEDCAVK